MRGESRFISAIPWAFLGVSHTCKFIYHVYVVLRKNILKIASLYHNILKGAGSELLVYYNFFKKCNIKLICLPFNEYSNKNLIGWHYTLIFTKFIFSLGLHFVLMKYPNIYFSLLYKVEYKVIIKIRSTSTYYHEATSLCPFTVCFSKCGPLTIITSITCYKCKFWGSSQTFWIKVFGWGPTISVVQHF